MTIHFQGQTILVTGGAGFIGSHLCERLLQLKARVICFDDLSTGTEKNLEDFKQNPGFQFIRGDVNDYRQISGVFAKNDVAYVFHYAARVGVLRTIEHPLEVLRDIDGIRNVLELVSRHKVKKIIFSSSSEVYGEPVEIPEREDGHLNPKLPYAVVKLVGENYLRAYHQIFGLKTCALRFFNVYGPRQDSSAYGFVAGIFLKQALRGKPLTVFGDGTQTRDFVYIDDNIEATLLSALSEKTDGEVINVGSGRPTTILDLAEHVIRVVGNKAAKIDFQSSRPGGEIKHRFPDISKMARLLGFRPRVTLEEGLRRTLDFYSHSTVLKKDDKAD